MISQRSRTSCLLENVSSKKSAMHKSMIAIMFKILIIWVLKTEVGLFAGKAMKAMISGLILVVELINSQLFFLVFKLATPTLVC